MNYTERRSCILEYLKKSETSIPASRLAEMFGVTRQIIVSDIALLRAKGNNIISTQRGYMIQREEMSGVLETISCRHKKEQISDEFYAIVDNGGSVLNVIIEHPVYGQISAELNISSRYDADEFVKKTDTSKANQLSDITGGLHYHTIRVPDADALERIISTLRENGILA